MLPARKMAKKLPNIEQDDGRGSDDDGGDADNDNDDDD